MVIERNQTQAQRVCDSINMKFPEQGKSIEPESRRVVARGWEEGRGEGMAVYRVWGFFLG